MAVTAWTTLKCSCGGEAFAPLVRLKFKEGGGTTTEPAGHYCIACQANVDPGYLAKLVEINAKRATVLQTMQELDALETSTKKEPAAK